MTVDTWDLTPAGFGARRRLALIASGIGERGGIFTLARDGVQRLTDEPTTGLAPWKGGSRLAAIEWSDEDPAPGFSTLHLWSKGKRKTLRVNVREPHGLIWRHRRLVAVSTADNSIVALDRQGHPRRRWKAPGGGDSWHLNSLTVTRRRLVVSAFGRFANHRQWAEDGNRNGHGIVFELPSGRTILGGLSCPHDPTFVESSLFVCNSSEEALVKFDPEGRELARANLGGWTRGLAFDERSWYVGVSAHRLLGGEGRARVVRLRRSTLEPTGEWELPCREVFALKWVTTRLFHALGTLNPTSLPGEPAAGPAA